MFFSSGVTATYMSTSNATLLNRSAWFSNNKSDMLTLEWAKEALATADNTADPSNIDVAVKLFGYSEIATGMKLESDIHTFTARMKNTGEYSFRPSEVKCQGKLCGASVGLIRIENLENNDGLGIWSPPFTLGWFSTHPQKWCSKTKDVGTAWPDEQDNLQGRCPGTLQEAVLIGRFRKVGCDGDSTYSCYLHPDAKYCTILDVHLKRIREILYQCCYDESDLLMYGADNIMGNFSAPSHRDGLSPYEEQYPIPYMSYLYHDVAPYLGCCAWPGEDSTMAICQQDFLQY